MGYPLDLFLLNDGTSHILLNDASSRLALNGVPVPLLANSVTLANPRSVLYQALANPVPIVQAAVQETITADKWYAAASEPVRRNIYPTAAQPYESLVQVIPAENVKLDWWAQASEPVRPRIGLLPASQEVEAFDTFPIVSGPENWTQPLNEPVRLRLLPISEQQTMEWSDFTPAPPMDSWFRLMSEPTRFSPQLKATQQALAYGYYPFVAWDWNRPLSEPVRLPSQLKGTQQALAYGFYPFVSGPENWTQPLSEPVRKPAQLRATQHALEYTALVPIPDTTVDKYWMAFSEPTRSGPQLKATQQFLAWPSQFTATAAETVTIDKWYSALGEPVRRNVLPSADYPTISFVTTIPAENVKLDWWAQASEPVRPRLGLLTASQQIEAFDTNPFVSGPENWRQPFSEPVRLRLLPISEQQTMEWSDFTPAPSMDSWFRLANEPVRLPVQLKATQQSLAYGYYPYVAWDWNRPLSEPVRQPAQLKSTQQALEFTALVPIPDTTVDKYFAAFSEPTRLAPQLKATQQYLAWGYYAPVPGVGPGPAAIEWYMPLSEPTRSARLPISDNPFLSFVQVIPSENVKLDWWSQASEPVRFSRRLPAADQQTLIWEDFTPAPPMDSWFQALGEPTRTKRLPIAAYPFLSAGYYPFVAWDWNRPLSEPVRLPSQLKATQQPLAYTALVPIPDTTLDKYWAAFSEPVRLPRVTQAGLTSSNWVQTVFEDVTLDKWFSALREPVRLSPQLLTALQQHQAFVKADPFPGVTPTVTGPGGGGRIIGTTFSRKKWRELQAALEAERRAELAAQELRNAKARDKAFAAAKMAERAIDVAWLEHQEVLIKLRRSLDALADANRTAEAIRRANATMALARQIIIQVEQDEEDTIMMLLS